MDSKHAIQLVVFLLGLVLLMAGTSLVKGSARIALCTIGFVLVCGTVFIVITNATCFAVRRLFGGGVQ